VAVAQLTSEIIRQQHPQIFFAGFFQGLLPKSTRSNKATIGLPCFFKGQMIRCHLKDAS
jgi:hypothetical protein